VRRPPTKTADREDDPRRPAAREVHVDASPASHALALLYGIDTPTARARLSRRELTIEPTREFLAADSLGYLSARRLAEAPSPNNARWLQGVPPVIQGSPQGVLATRASPAETRLPSPSRGARSRPRGALSANERGEGHQGGRLPPSTGPCRPRPAPPHRRDLLGPRAPEEVSILRE